MHVDTCSEREVSMYLLWGMEITHWLYQQGACSQLINIILLIIQDYHLCVQIVELR